MCLLISDRLLRTSFLRRDRKQFVHRFHIFGCKPKNPFPAIVEQGVQLAVSSVLDQGRHLATAVQHAAAALCPAALILGCVQPHSAAPVLLPLRALQLGVHLGVMEQALSQGRK